MIAQLATLLQDSNASQAQINLRVDQQGLTTVVLNITQNSPTKPESKDALELRALLSRPIVITGDKDDLDVEMVEELTRYSQVYVDDASSLQSLPSTQPRTTKKSSAPKEKVQAPVKEEKPSDPVQDFSNDEVDSL